MDGSATLTIVTSRSSMKVAKQTATSVHHFAIAVHTTAMRARRMTDAASAEDAGLRQLPPALWRRIRADPVHAPEHIALAAAARHGPAARDWTAERRRTYALSAAELARMAKRRHAALARAGGAAGGLGGIVTLVPDLAAAAWIQSRCVYFVAAAFGFDPLDRMRPAEQLVLQGVYRDVGEARRALDGAGRSMAQAMAEAQLGAVG